MATEKTNASSAPAEVDALTDQKATIPPMPELVSAPAAEQSDQAMSPPPAPAPPEPLARYALVNAGAVANVIECGASFASDIGAQHDAVVLIGSANVGIGWAWSADAGFAEPKQAEPQPAGREIDPIALYERFTFAERVGITRAGQINAADSADKQTLAATVQRFEKDLSVYKRPINLDGDGLAKGLGLLASLKILEADWQDRIVKAPITDTERAYA